MTPAEFRVLRESLGLSAQWVADRAGVALRTVQYWEAGKRAKIPKRACDILTGIDAEIDRAVNHAIEEHVPDGRACEVKLIWHSPQQAFWRAYPELDGLPLSSQAAMLSRIQRALSGWARVSIGFETETLDDDTGSG